MSQRRYSAKPAKKRPNDDEAQHTRVAIVADTKRNAVVISISPAGQWLWLTPQEALTIARKLRDEADKLEPPPPAEVN